MPNPTIPQSYAVSEIPLSKRAATSPLSQDWKLYDPKILADELGLPVEQVNAALTKTGYNKAIRQKEELIRWKCRLVNEYKDVSREIRDVYRHLKNLKDRRRNIEDTMENTRNLLRIPREPIQPIAPESISPRIRAYKQAKLNAPLVDMPVEERAMVAN